MGDCASCADRQGLANSSCYRSGFPRCCISAKDSQSSSSDVRRIFATTRRPSRSFTRPARSQLHQSRYEKESLLGGYRLGQLPVARSIFDPRANVSRNRERRSGRRLVPTSISSVPQRPTRVFARSLSTQPVPLFYPRREERRRSASSSRHIDTNSLCNQPHFFCFVRTQAGEMVIG